jgi:hypothetical protein
MLRATFTPTLLRTALHNTRKITRKPRSHNLRRIQELRVPRPRLKHFIRCAREETMRSLDTAGIVFIEAGYEDCGLAFRVELPVDQSPRKEHASVLGQRGFDLRIRQPGDAPPSCLDFAQPPPWTS